LTEDPNKLILLYYSDFGDFDTLNWWNCKCFSTRVVQKLISTLKSKRQIALVRSAIQPSFLDLVKDLNGNHVIQRCLSSWSVQDNEVYILLFFLFFMTCVTFNVDHYCWIIYTWKLILMCAIVMKHSSYLSHYSTSYFTVSKMTLIFKFVWPLFITRWIVLCIQRLHSTSYSD
jgi:hypothetical protein